MGGEGREQKDLSVGYRTLAVVVPLYGLALIVYFVRIWTRIRPKYRLNAADHTITVAFLAETISIILSIVAVSWGFGRPPSQLSTTENEIIGCTTFIVFVIALWASAFARISISCLLLQITQDRVWRHLLWFSVAFQGVALAACDICQLAQCRPIRALWAPVPDKVCVPTDQILIVAWVFSGISIVSDIICAVFPILLIWRLSRSPVEKALISVLMGLGLLAAFAGVFKVLVLRSFNPMSENVVGDMMPAYMWIRIEEILLIIAACAPFLKSPVESLLHRHLGLPLIGAPAIRDGNTASWNTKLGP
ncbi:hypothetical protein MFIFM68171_10039 [Madurella fahalii]|uniref:Rhodopsin domain-containing protein n=1 Tax=Madurella fahalii TaxID=1157608 RepID=A0ABQ0GQ05_9PEZI